MPIQAKPVAVVLQLHHATVAASQSTNQAGTPPSAPANPKPVAVSAATPTPSICTPSNYAGVGDINLDASHPGLTQLVDATYYYQIYGYDSAQVQQQIQRCAPRLSGNDDFTGYTSYRLQWQYAYVAGDNGLCELYNVKVGIRIGEVLPALQTTQPSAGFAAKWQTFAASLDTHERGHVALDEQYAAKLLSDLQAFPATDCASISGAIDTLTHAELAALAQANVDYDTQTNHGATQGALLP